MSKAIIYKKLYLGELLFPKPPFFILNRHISIENSQCGSDLLSTRHKKSAFILKESVDCLAEKFSINFMGFLTLTFAEHILCPKEAQKRLNSLLSNVIKT